MPVAALYLAKSAPLTVAQPPTNPAGRFATNTRLLNPRIVPVKLTVAPAARVSPLSSDSVVDAPPLVMLIVLPLAFRSTGPSPSVVLVSPPYKLSAPPAR